MYEHKKVFSVKGERPSVAMFTWGDLLYQDGDLAGQGEAMRVEAQVSLDLNVKAKRVISLIGATGLGCFPIRCSPVPEDEEVIFEKNDPMMIMYCNFVFSTLLDSIIYYIRQ